MFRCIGRVAAVVGVFALALAPAAGAQVEPYGSGDYGGFRNILPPGQSGFDNLLQAAQFKASGTYPPHSNDQLGMYSSWGPRSRSPRRRSRSSTRTRPSGCRPKTWPAPRAPSQA